ncbi:MAG: ChbG/HpnK family deacetylase [Solirubrobacteraceae bacterium]
MRSTPLLIVNADDLGIEPRVSNAILECFQSGSISSTTALVWMRDSDRAAEIARHAHIPTGLHLNLIEPYTAPDVPPRVAQTQRRVVERLGKGGLGPQLYHRAWSEDFGQCIRDQLSRFTELYGVPPTHVDGHRHMHLAMNALLSRALQPVRRCRRPVNRPARESASYKRLARSALSVLVRLRFITTDACFSVRSLHPELGGSGLDETLARADRSSIELFVHPGYRDELPLLRSAAWRAWVATHRLGSFEDLR